MVTNSTRRILEPAYMFALVAVSTAMAGAEHPLVWGMLVALWYVVLRYSHLRMALPGGGALLASSLALLLSVLSAPLAASPGVLKVLMCVLVAGAGWLLHRALNVPVSINVENSDGWLGCYRLETDDPSRLRYVPENNSVKELMWGVAEFDFVCTKHTVSLPRIGITGSAKRSNVFMGVEIAVDRLNAGSFLPRTKEWTPLADKAVADALERMPQLPSALYAGGEEADTLLAEFVAILPTSLVSEECAVPVKWNRTAVRLD